MPDESTTDETADDTTKEGSDDAPESGGSDKSSGPSIGDDQQADIPSNISVSADEIEDEAGAQSDESDESDADDGESDAESMAPDEGTDTSPIKAGELYVTVVQQATNAAIRSRDDSAEEVPREHFENYDLARYFDETMDELGVGSDLDPHEALLLATALSVGEPILTRTDVMDEQIGRLMDKAAGGGEAAA